MERVVRLVVSIFIVLLLSISGSEAGCGMLGCALKDIGLKGFGEAADDFHDDVKKRVTVYGTLEEGISKMIRDLADDVCAAPFQIATTYVAVDCSNWDHRLEGQDEIQALVREVTKSGLARPEEFQNLQLRWCPLNGASGMAPDRNFIYLDSDLKGGNIWDQGALLIHELTHVRQYRRQGSDDFKCEYSRKFVDCGGCQDGGHPHEQEAYEAESYALSVLRKLYGG
jgi:hypothetical protein